MVGQLLDKPYFDELGERGIAWVRECLENGEGLSRIVLSKADLTEGHTYIAVAVHEHAVAIAGNRPLNHGAINRSAIDTEPQLQMLIDKLRELEKKTGPLTVLVEDNLRHPSDPVERLPRLPTYQFRDRYLYAQNLLDIRFGYDFEVLGQSSGYPLNAFVVLSRTLPTNTHWSDSYAEKLASAVIGIINFAYDGETYTLWVKKVV